MDRTSVGAVSFGVLLVSKPALGLSGVNEGKCCVQTGGDCA